MPNPCPGRLCLLQLLDRCRLLKLFELFLWFECVEFFSLCTPDTCETYVRTGGLMIGFVQLEIELVDTRETYVSIPCPGRLSL